MFFALFSADHANYVPSHLFQTVSASERETRATRFYFSFCSVILYHPLLSAYNEKKQKEQQSQANNRKKQNEQINTMLVERK
jgi:hypothetical protein